MRNVRLMVWWGETVQVECYRVSVVNGRQQTASGDGLKGIFITITDQTSGYKCVIPNSDTGACACPGSMYDSRYGFYLEHLLRNMMNVVVVVVRTSTVIVILEGYMHANKILNSH